MTRTVQLYCPINAQIRPVDNQSDFENFVVVLIIIEINGHNQRPRGPCYWVFNATLLEDKNYVDELNNKIPQIIDYYRGIDDKGLFWEIIKMEIRAVSIAYSKRKAKTLREYENELTNKAQALLRDYNETNSRQTIDQYNKIKKELEHISFTLTNVSCIRSKARWYAQSIFST